ncbi:MAG TPA: TetR/AcrR family transcriptional regulator [Pseudonocardiaceae bacterium]
MDDSSPRSRRRGAELEDAILDAAWRQLAEGGGQGFTFEAVAERAHTSRTVLYRRWPTRTDLLVAAARRRMHLTTLPVPDTGSLRGDLLAVLRGGNEKRSDIYLMLGAAGQHFDDLRLTPEQLRERAIAGGQLAIGTILDRARARHEIPSAGLPERVGSLPFALLRAEIIMTLRPVSDDVIRSIVDEVFLPLVRAYGHGLGATGF